MIRLLLLATGLLLCFALTAQDFDAPKATTVPYYDTLFGEVFPDPYRWITNKEDPEVMNYLYAENAYADRTLQSTEILQKNLYEEIKGYSRERFSSLPTRRDSFYYYNRYDKHSNYPIIARKKDSLTAEEEIVLDGNKLAKGQSYFVLQFVSVSFDHQLVAYGRNQYGGDAGDLRIKDIVGDSLLPDKIPGVGGVVWAKDNKTLFYIFEDPKTKRANRIFRHRIGTPKEADVLVYEEKRPGYFPSIGLSDSRDYILLMSSSFVDSKVWVLPSDQPEAAFQPFGNKLPKAMYQLDHTAGNEWTLLTDFKAPNYRVVRLTSLQQPTEDWKNIVTVHDSSFLQDFRMLKDYQITHILEKGTPVMRVLNRSNDSSFVLPFPDGPFSVSLLGSSDYQDSVIRYSYTSMVVPSQVHEYNLRTGHDTIIRKTEVKGYKARNFESKRVWAPSRDGKRIAVDLLYKKGFKPNGSHPVMMNAYGSYGNNIDPSFTVSRLGYLERGFVIAIPHVRGESFLGVGWHDDGKLLNKQNTFNDVVDATEYLIAQGYADPSRIALQGGSAGGLLVGAVINDRPDLYCAAIANAPFVDVFFDMHDEDWPNIVAHYDEIGNPKIREYHDYLLSYCPYHNLKAQDYPHVLVTNGLNDSRVPYWAPAKWVAKMRTLKTDSNLLLLKTDMSGGHFGASGRYERWKETAQEMAFVFQAMGIRENYLVVSGKVLDVNKEPLPYVNVFLEGSTKGTTTNYDGEFALEVKEDKLNDLVLQYVGYEKKSLPLSIDMELTGLEITLESEDIQLPQFTVSAKAKDPAYGIIKNAIARRKYYLDQVGAYSTDLYMKGATRLNEIPDKLPPFLSVEDLPDSNDLGLIYLSESVTRLHNRKPTDRKEEMIASKVAGQSAGFSWNRASDVLFNFYENRIKLRDVSERDFVSPISSGALLYYKYSLVGTFRENGKTINKIKVLPRRKSDPIFHGHIYIVEDDWNIHSLDVFLTKDAQIEFVDTIHIAQAYLEMQDSIWMPFSLKISYEYKVFGFDATYRAMGVFSNYRINRSFPEKFFRNEIFRIERGANRKDSNYWEVERPLILTEEEVSSYRRSDSLELLQKSPEYRDSVDAQSNRITLGKVFLSGYDHTNSIDSIYWGTNSLLGALQYNNVEGGVLNVKPWFFKWRKDGFTRYNGAFRYGEASEKAYGKLRWQRQFSNFSKARLSITGGHYIEQINGDQPIDPLVNSLYTLLREQHFIRLYERSFGEVNYFREWLNGLYGSIAVEYADRQAVASNRDYRLVDVPNRVFADNSLENYPSGPARAMALEVKLTYRHKQKYATYPDRKRAYGSAYPTLYAHYRKGLHALGSEVNYDFLSLGLGDDLNLGLLGVAKYDVIAGSFLNRRSMAVYDFQHFMGNQTTIAQNSGWSYNQNSRNQMRQFQTLDYYSNSTNRSFLEGHYEQHFNGFLLNKFPLIRKLKWQTVAGANVLLTEDRGDYTEVFVGIENIFRFLRVDFASSYESGGSVEPQFRLGLDLGF